MIAARREMRKQTLRAHLGRDLQRPLQRDPVPLGRRSRDADDRHAARPLPLRRHSLVFDDIRPRRPDHGAADAVVVAGGRARRAAPARLSIRPRPPILWPTRSPARSCTRCAAAKWRRCAKCRSGSITAASIQRRSSCCSRAFMPSAPATSTPSPNCGRRSKRRSAGSTVRAIRTATALSNISAPPIRASPNQGWKDSHDAIFHADGRLAEGAIALVEVQGYVYAAKLMAARCARRLGHEAAAEALDAASAAACRAL